MVSDYTGMLALDAGFLDPVFETRGNKLCLVICKDGIESIQVEARDEREMIAELSRMLVDQIQVPILEDWDEKYR